MLASKLLSGNSRLQRCAVEHPAHVQQGDSGPHVRLIHLALMLADGANIAQAEVSASRYGQSTVDAVLSYKTKRAIINRTYQTKPDAIVGIMTIRALDAEIAAQELVNGIASSGRSGAVQVRTKR